jgi:hypothetical protein
MAQKASSSPQKNAEAKAEDFAPDPAEALPDPSDVPSAPKASAKLPVYDEEAKLRAIAEVRQSVDVLSDTPSGYALKKLGNLDGEDVDHGVPGASQAALDHGNAYQRLKSAVRWGYVVPGDDDK